MISYVEEYLCLIVHHHQQNQTAFHRMFSLLGLTNRFEFSRDDIAQYIGTATESLIRTLSDFKAERHIDIKSGKIIVNNVEGLKNLQY